MIYSVFIKYWGGEYNEAVHQLFMDFKEAYDSVRRKFMYNILIEFGIPIEYAIRKFQVNQDGLKLNGKHQLLFYGEEAYIL